MHLIATVFKGSFIGFRSLHSITGVGFGSRHQYRIRCIEPRKVWCWFGICAYLRRFRSIERSCGRRSLLPSCRNPMFTPYASRGHWMISYLEKEKGLPSLDFRTLVCILFFKERRGDSKSSLRMGGILKWATGWVKKGLDIRFRCGSYVSVIRRFVSLCDRGCWCGEPDRLDRGHDIWVSEWVCLYWYDCDRRTVVVVRVLWFCSKFQFPKMGILLHIWILPRSS